MAAAELLSDEGYRADGRRPSELRKVRARLGVFAQADGSAYIEQGNTKALAVVYGPHEVRGSRSRCPPERALLTCRFSLAAFSTGERRRRPPPGSGTGPGDRQSSEWGALLKQSLEAAVLTQLFPRSQIDVHVQILQADGGSFCAGVNAATLALVEAGIPMRDYVCASTAGLAEDTPLADLSWAEEGAGGPRLALALLPRGGQMVLLQLSPRLHQERLQAVLEAAGGACRALHSVLEGAVRERLREVTALLGD